MERPNQGISTSPPINLLGYGQQAQAGPPPYGVHAGARGRADVFSSGRRGVDHARECTGRNSVAQLKACTDLMPSVCCL